MTAALARILPMRLRHAVAKRLRALKAPRMIRGYADASGTYHERTRVSDTALLYRPERISIADNVFIGHYTILDGTGGVRIGEGAQLAAGAWIFTHSSHIAIRLYGKHYQEIPEEKKEGYQVKEVIIGRYAFIGSGAKIFPGVRIGDGAVVYAGSTVTKDVGDFQVVSGTPADVIADAKALDQPYLGNAQLLEWYREWQKN